jgi:sec-independent protein translocase protein TatA
MLPNLGPGELILILAVALIVFGPKKLPEIGKGIGNALREFNKARNDFMDTINTGVDQDEPVRAASYTETPALSPAETPANTASRQIEYPEPLDAGSADALPYGSAFNAVEGDSQPSFRTAQPEPTPAASVANENTPVQAGEGRA